MQNTSTANLGPSISIQHQMLPNYLPLCCSNVFILGSKSLGGILRTFFRTTHYWLVFQTSATSCLRSYCLAVITSVRDWHERLSRGSAWNISQSYVFAVPAQSALCEQKQMLQGWVGKHYKKQNSFKNNCSSDKTAQSCYCFPPTAKQQFIAKIKWTMTH